MSSKVDLTDRRFGLWTVVAESGLDKHGSWAWLCRCDCGVERVVRGSQLTQGRSRSCGCVPSKGTTTHGQTHAPLYKRWQGMLGRTLYPTNAGYEVYGGRGIIVCERWHTFENFAADMGDGFKPELWIDRIDAEGNYEPGNCRWVTPREQFRNLRKNRYIAFAGRSHIVDDWAPILGLNASTLRVRLFRGWSVERALTKGADPAALAALTAEVS